MPQLHGQLVPEGPLSRGGARWAPSSCSLSPLLPGKPTLVQAFTRTRSTNGSWVQTETCYDSRPDTSFCHGGSSKQQFLPSWETKRKTRSLGAKVGKSRPCCCPGPENRLAGCSTSVSPELPKVGLSEDRSPPRGDGNQHPCRPYSKLPSKMEQPIQRVALCRRRQQDKETAAPIPPSRCHHSCEAGPSASHLTVVPASLLLSSHTAHGTERPKKERDSITTVLSGPCGENHSRPCPDCSACPRTAGRSFSVTRELPEQKTGLGVRLPAPSNRCATGSQH